MVSFAAQQKHIFCVSTEAHWGNVWDWTHTALVPARSSPTVHTFHQNEPDFPPSSCLPTTQFLELLLCSFKPPSVSKWSTSLAPVFFRESSWRTFLSQGLDFMFFVVFIRYFYIEIWYYNIDISDTWYYNIDILEFLPHSNISQWKCQVTRK